MAESDEEQIEAIKRWWDENGTSILVGVVLVVGGVLGFQGWQNHVRDTGEAAAAIYANLLEATRLDSPFDEHDEESLQTAQFLASQLKNEYSGSSYAHFAALLMAKQAVEAGDLDAAGAELAWAMDDGVDESLRPVVVMRLARVQNAQGRQQDALKTLLSVEPGEHEPSWREVRGDIYLAMGDRELARESYEQALAALENPQSRPILQIKLNDLEVPQVTAPADEPAASAEAESEDS